MDSIEYARNAAPKVKHCEICGKPFCVVYPRQAQKYCSAGCANEMKKLQHRQYISQHPYRSKKTVHIRICKKCGKEFNAFYTQAYCTSCLTSGGEYMNKLARNRKDDLGVR